MAAIVLPFLPSLCPSSRGRGDQSPLLVGSLSLEEGWSEWPSNITNPNRGTIFDVPQVLRQSSQCTPQSGDVLCEVNLDCGSSSREAVTAVEFTPHAPRRPAAIDSRASDFTMGNYFWQVRQESLGTPVTFFVLPWYRLSMPGLVSRQPAPLGDLTAGVHGGAPRGQL